MRRSFETSRRVLVVVAVGAAAAIGVGAVALAAGGADSSKAKVKLKCPAKVRNGTKVSCKVFGKLPQGAKGDTGSTGAPGVSGYEVATQTFPEVYVGHSALSKVETVTCPGGKRVIGGGFDLGTNLAQTSQILIKVSRSGPNGTGTGWSVQLFNRSTSGTDDSVIDLRIFAICANVS